MAITAQQLAAELRAFSGRRVIVQSMRRALTRAARPVTAEVRAHAEEILPHRGGLGAWVAAAKVNVRISYSARSAGIRLRGSRGSGKGKADLTGIDAGSVRHPSWGRRSAGSWHAQAVPAGWWSKPLEHQDGFREQVDAAVDSALNEIRG